MSQNINKLLQLIIIYFIYSNLAFSQVFDFDAISNEKGSGPTVTHGKGFERESLNSIKKFRETDRMERLENMQKHQAQRATGNGSRYYLCEYSCRTSGLLYEGTDKSKFTVKADESWQAENEAGKRAKEICGNIRGTEGFHKGESMYTNNIRCEEKR